MKNPFFIYLIALWWALAPFASASPLLVPFLGGGVSGGGGGGGATYLLEENFEATGSPGYDTATWTESGSPDENASTSGLSLQASECLNFNPAAATWNTTSPTFTAQSTVYVYFLFRFASLPSGGTWTMFQVRSTSAELARVRVNVSGQIALRAGGGTEANLATSISTNTTYHGWLKYTKGTGVNAVVEFGYSTDGTRPTSGGTYNTQTVGTATVDGDRIMFGQTSSNTVGAYFDKVRVDDAVIGDNPS